LEDGKCHQPTEKNQHERKKRPTRSRSHEKEHHMNTNHNRFGTKNRIARVLAGSAISAALAASAFGLASPANADFHAGDSTQRVR
jgi:hypothetical protein